MDRVRWLIGVNLGEKNLYTILSALTCRDGIVTDQRFTALSHQWKHSYPAHLLKILKNQFQNKWNYVTLLQMRWMN